jgi:hypothetical protein
MEMQQDCCYKCRKEIRKYANDDIGEVEVFDLPHEIIPEDDDQ